MQQQHLYNEAQSMVRAREPREFAQAVERFAHTTEPPPPALNPRVRFAPPAQRGKLDECKSHLHATERALAAEKDRSSQLRSQLEKLSADSHAVLERTKAVRAQTISTLAHIAAAI